MTTLRDLSNDSTASLPVQVGGVADGSHTEALGEVHAERLLLWAGIVALPQHTSVEIARHRGRPGGKDALLPPEPVDFFGRLNPPAGATFRLMGWELVLRPPGLPARDVILTYEGHVFDQGTEVEQDARWQKYSKQQVEDVRRKRVELGYGPADTVDRTTRALRALRQQVELAEAAWKAAIRDAGGVVSLSEVARLGGVDVDEVRRIQASAELRE